MLLYHGTSAKNLSQILASGIRPRDPKEKGHWTNCPSRTDRVYMTECYSQYFAFCCDPKSSVIFEIDTDMLDSKLMGTDEDIVAQIIAQRTGQNLIKVTKALDVNQYDDRWESLLSAMGNCSYKGVIPPEAIRRYVIINWKENLFAELNSWDTTVSILNYQFLKATHQRVQGWLFGDEKDPFSEEKIMATRLLAQKLQKVNRKGLTVVENKKYAQKEKFGVSY